MDQLTVRLREALPKLLADVTWRGEMFAGEATPGLDADVGLSAILKILSVDAYQPDVYSADEQQFLIDWGLVVDTDRGRMRSTSLEEDLGARLFQLLFPNVSAARQFFEARRKSAGGLEIALELDPNPTIAGQLPWELLWSEPDFLTVGAQGTLSRRFVFDGREANRTEVQFSELRVLVISPRPQDERFADLGDAEVSALRQVCGLAIECLTPPTIDQLGRYLDAYGGSKTPHVIHFDGHGTYGRACRVCKWVSPRLAPTCVNPGCGARLDGKPVGFLAFEDANRAANLVSAENVSVALGQAVTDENSALRLVVLSACRSASSIGARSEFSGVAQRLISSSVPAVVAMQFAVDLHAAIAFSHRLYSNLVDGRSVLDAVRRARSGLKAAGESQWYRPVVYLDVNSGQGRFFRKVEADPIRLPARERGDRLVDDIEEVERAIIALAQRIPFDPRICAVMLPFRGAFVDCQAELDTLGDYKDLHDKLHGLSYWYGLLDSQLDDDTGPRRDALRMYTSMLADYVAGMEEIIAREHVTKRSVTWMSDLQAALATLRRMAGAPSEPVNQFPLRRLGPLLGSVPAQINASLDSAARRLGFGELAHALECWQEVASRTELRPDESADVRQASAGCAALKRVDDVLTDMIDEHSRRQDLDREIGLGREVLNDDVQSFASHAWPELHAELEPQWRVRLETKVDSLLAERDRFDMMVKNQTYDKLPDQFENCVSAAVDYFHGLDLQVKSVCDRLRSLGTPLLAVVDALDRREAIAA